MRVRRVEHPLVLGIRLRHAEVEHGRRELLERTDDLLAVLDRPCVAARDADDGLAVQLTRHVRDGRRLTVHLLPGDPHALMLEEEVANFRPDALDRLGLTRRETEVLWAAAAIEEEADIAWELCLSLHAVRDRLAHLEAKLEVHTAADAVTRALREST